MNCFVVAPIEFLPPLFLSEGIGDLNMYQYKGLEDTIAAIATPAGQGGIGIIRISGQDAVAIADAVLRLQGK